MSGCNGLVIDAEKNAENPFTTIHIWNPATNQSLTPPIINYARNGGIAFSKTSNKYKMVVSYVAGSWGFDFGLKIQTFGVDKSWRNLAVDHLPGLSMRSLIEAPFITEGFMHWALSGVGTLLTLDVETETLTLNEFPVYVSPWTTLSFLSGLVKSYYLLSTGRFLSRLVQNRDFSWEVWGLKSESGEWNKVVPDIKLEGHMGRLEELAPDASFALRPVGWVNYPEVLAFANLRGICIFYNLDTHEINSTQLPYSDEYVLIAGFVHNNTLLRLS